MASVEFRARKELDLTRKYFLCCLTGPRADQTVPRPSDLDRIARRQYQ